MLWKHRDVSPQARSTHLVSMLLIATMAVASFALSPTALAQGCIVARSSSQLMGPESQAGYLQPGEFESSVSYRHQFSFRHFVGSEEQTYRVQQGTQVMNKINLQDLTLTYGVSTRCSLSLDVPVLLASRRSNNSPYTTTAQGLGDLGVSAQAWVWNPKKARRGNMSVGIGVVLPTGKSDVTNKVDKFDGKGPQPVVVDYSIQPGTGGTGIVFRWQAFRAVFGGAVAYVNGNYIATPQNFNNTLRTGQSPSSLTAYNSISDQYLIEGGITRPFSRIRGLTWSLGPRIEGVPAYDLIGDDMGFRRPGYAISIVPGFQYARSGQMFSFGIGKAIYRNRTQSATDALTGTHGDAAFADYVWLGSYSARFGGPGHGER
jgi:hypothetical protein